LITLERPDAASASAVVASVDSSSRDQLQRHFERHHWILVPGFFGPKLLDEIRREVDRSKFERRADEMGGELKLGPETPIVKRLLFIVNEPAVHRAVEAATGIERIARFDGRIYRRAPVPEHYHVWHDDVAGETRLVAMSVNLSEGAYGGGVLEMRRKGARHMLARVQNTGAGDALMFRVHPDLQHCITDVTAGTKTSLAGWFGAAPPWPLRPELSSARAHAPGKQANR
jgi:2OG-Fe(II) oxygenase superfamily